MAVLGFRVSRAPDVISLRRRPGLAFAPPFGLLPPLPSFTSSSSLRQRAREHLEPFLRRRRRLRFLLQRVNPERRNGGYPSRRSRKGARVELSGAGRRVSQKAASSVAEKGEGCVVGFETWEKMLWLPWVIAGWLPFFEPAARAWMKTFDDTFKSFLATLEKHPRKSSLMVSYLKNRSVRNLEAVDHWERR